MKRAQQPAPPVSNREAHARSERALNALLRAAVVTLPAAAALSHALLVDDGARDGSLVHALGLGVSRGASAPLGALESWIAAPFSVMPLGTYVFRLAIPSAIAAGVAASAIHRIALRFAGDVTQGAAPRLASAVAAIAALAATLSVPWQAEAAGPLGTTLVAAAFLSALAFATEGPTLGACLAKLRAAPRAPFALTIAALVAFAIVRGARSELSLDEGALASGVASFEPRARIAAIFTHALGPVTSVLVASGAVLAVVRALSRSRSRDESRKLAAILASALAVSLVVAGGAPFGPERYGASALVAVALAWSFAAAFVTALVLHVARLRVPLAEASAAMVALLAAAFPAMAFDESSLAAEARSSLERVDVAASSLSALSPGTLVVGDDARAMRRLITASLVGETPTPLVFVPLYDVGGRMMRRELAETPALVPLLRDVTLTGAPTELALTNLAAERPLAVSYSPRWDRALARHLVPRGLVDGFDAEPRGIADRRAGMEEAERVLSPLAPALKAASADTLAGSLATILRARALGLDAIRDHELTPRAVADAESLLSGAARRDAENALAALPSMKPSTQAGPPPRERRDVARR